MSDFVKTMGVNREYIGYRVLHIGQLLADRPERFLERPNLIVVPSAQEFTTLFDETCMIDLVGAGGTSAGETAAAREGHDGIAP